MGEYYVSVWAKAEFTPRVEADSKEEAAEIAKERVTMEHPVTPRDISNVTEDDVDEI